jgi:glycosyltransferase involved in cell wall biosynthesis
MEPVKVTFISSHAQLGGSEKSLEETMGALGRPWIADVISLQDGPAVTRFEQHHPVHVIHTGAGKLQTLRTAARVRSRLRSKPPDLVHASGVKAALIATLATLPGGPPVVWFKHDSTFDGPLARVIARRCAITVGASEAVLEAVKGKASTAAIFPGVTERPTDPARARERLAHSHSVAPNAEIVSLVARLHPSKGHEELIAVAGSLTAERPHLVFLLIGGDDPGHPGHRAQLQQRVAELGLEQRVLFLGYRDDIADLIAASDVLVVPSVVDSRGSGKEGFGLVAVEAMLSGTVVVAYAHGALPEVMGDTGISVDPGDRSALADAIARALSDEDRSGMIEAARRRAARFSPDRAVEAIKKLYRDVAAR